MDQCRIVITWPARTDTLSRVRHLRPSPGRSLNLLSQNAGGALSCQLNSVCPIRFQIKDANGRYVSNATPKVYLSKDGSGGEQPATSGIRGVLDNAFSFSSKGSQYSFSLQTKGLTKGAWTLRIEFLPGYSHSLPLTIR